MKAAMSIRCNKRIVSRQMHVASPRSVITPRAGMSSTLPCPFSPPPLPRPPQLRMQRPQKLPILCTSTSYSIQDFNSSSPSSSGERRQLSHVIDDFINLPWQKIASWASVALLATQLRDFLGVRIVIFFFLSFLHNYTPIPSIHTH